MKKWLIGVFFYTVIITGTAWGQDAMHFYNLGIDSSLAYKKISYFTKALELNPNLVAAYSKRGMLYYFQEKYDRMIQDFLRVAELKPFTSDAYAWLGLAHLKKGNLDEALFHLDRAVELTPPLADAYGYRSEAYRLKGMAEEAIRDATRAIELGGPEQIIGMAHSTRAKAYRELGKSGLADVDLKLAIKLNPDYHIYPHFATTEFLVNLSMEPTSLNRLSRVGAFWIIALLFVVIFKLVLPPPNKRQ